MKDEKAAKALIKKLDKLLRSKMTPIYKRYGVSMQDVLTPLMWKPLVLVIGNYSSGKSTFINERQFYHPDNSGGRRKRRRNTGRHHS